MCNYAQRVTILGLVFVSSLSLMGFKKNDEKPETFTEKKVIKAETSFEFSRSVTRTYQLIKKDGKVVGKELVREERIEAIDTTYHVGKGGYNTSRGSFGRVKTMVMKASAYEPGPLSNGRWAHTTTLGVRPKYGIVAVDPRTIKLGSLLYVEGYGFAYAADTGSAIKGNRIDLCFATQSQCNRFGRQNVVVHVLSSK